MADQIDEKLIVLQYPWMHSESLIVEALSSNVETGLSHQEAAQRLHRYGRNEIEEDQGVPWYVILIKQCANAMVIVLLAAMAVSFGIRSWIEGGVIAAVIALNIAVGFFQELKAEKHMNSLKNLSSSSAQVIRDGKQKSVDSGELVPGDIVELRSGDTVPADIRLLSVTSFETDEALLTGESLPISKHPDTIEDVDCPVGDRINLAFSSSCVTKGRATGIVIKTGMNTEIGLIAAAMRDDKYQSKLVRKEDGSLKWYSYPLFLITFVMHYGGQILGVNVGTPLHRKLAKLAILLLVVAIIAAVIVFAVNSFSNDEPVIIYAVAVAISMIPASLLAVLTITMAAGSKHMVERHVVVRKLDALEALGAVSDICSDKTGTLTQGKMVLKKVWIPNSAVYSVEKQNVPFDPYIAKVSRQEGDPIADDDLDTDFVEPQSLLNEELEKFLEHMALSTIAKISFDENTKEWIAIGDPTETAIVVFSEKFQRAQRYYTESLGYSLLAEYPFDSDVKRMSMIFAGPSNGKIRCYLKGAVERVLDCCTHYYIQNSQQSPLTDEYRDYILDCMEAITAKGLRCLAFASRDWTDEKYDFSHVPSRHTVESNMTFAGLVGIYDPPRVESAQAVQNCKSAGIAVHMLTGDHIGTARAIAQEIGIVPMNLDVLDKETVDQLIMTASQFDKLSEKEIDDRKFLPAVIARCAPQTKVRMIEALHRRKKFCAMTGDGVNDSPSLKRADIGIAMGKSGSDVAKEASDLVLTDDNFASITNAIEEGRRMFDNIQKFVLHLLAANVAQAIYLLAGLAFKDSSRESVFPISPIEILWIIMICQSFPAMGLGYEKAAPNVMQRPPHNLRKGVFTYEVIIDMFVYGIIMAILCLVGFVLIIFAFGNGSLGTNCNREYSNACETVFKARSTTFSQLTIYMLILAWEMIHFRRSIFWLDPNHKDGKLQIFNILWENQFLFWSICAGFLTIFPVIYIPVINRKVFKHSPIGWEWAIVIISVLVFILAVELYKYSKRYCIRKFDLDPPPLKSGNWWDLERVNTKTLSFKKFASFARSERSLRSNLSQRVRKVG